MIKKAIGTLFPLFVGSFVFAQTKQYLFDFELGIAQSAVYDDGYSLAKYKQQPFFASLSKFFKINKLSHLRNL